MGLIELSISIILLKKKVRNEEPGKLSKPERERIHFHIWSGNLVMKVEFRIGQHTPKGVNTKEKVLRRWYQNKLYYQNRTDSEGLHCLHWNLWWASGQHLLLLLASSLQRKSLGSRAGWWNFTKSTVKMHRDWTEKSGWNHREVLQLEQRIIKNAVREFIL